MSLASEGIAFMGSKALASLFTMSYLVLIPQHNKTGATTNLPSWCSNIAYLFTHISLNLADLSTFVWDMEHTVLFKYLNLHLGGIYRK